MSFAIQASDLAYTYPAPQEGEGIQVFSGLNLRVEAGSFVAILGRNGCGKSTLAKQFNAIVLPSGGTVHVFGMDTRQEENLIPIRRTVGMVFQNPDNQFVGATVEDDVAFGLENKGIPLDEMKERVAKALDLVGMSEFADREPSRLSGGQKQRVAIAGALAMQPDIIILDEATSMLDPEGRLELIKTIREIRKQYQMTVVSITHDLDEVALSDRVLVMKKGKVESSSTPEELFNRGDDLLTLGLDVPFSTNLISALKDKGFDFTQNYLTEKDLEDQLWELLLKT